MESLPPSNYRIKQLIEHFANGNVKAFAESLQDISYQSLNRLFNIDTRTGKYPGVSSSIVKAITKIYSGVDSNWILNGEGNIFTPDNAFPHKLSDIRNGEPSTMQILDRLSLAFSYNSKALADQAEGFKAQAKAFEAQTELLKSIESKMPQQADQQTIKEKVQSLEDRTKEIGANSSEILAGVLSMSIRQKEAIRQFARDLEELKSRKNAPSRGSGKRLGENGGAEKKQDKRG